MDIIETVKKFMEMKDWDQEDTGIKARPREISLEDPYSKRVG